MGGDRNGLGRVSQSHRSQLAKRMGRAKLRIGSQRDWLAKGQAVFELARKGTGSFWLWLAKGQAVFGCGQFLAAGSFWLRAVFGSGSFWLEFLARVFGSSFWLEFLARVFGSSFWLEFLARVFGSLFLARCFWLAVFGSPGKSFMVGTLALP